MPAGERDQVPTSTVPAARPAPAPRTVTGRDDAAFGGRRSVRVGPGQPRPQGHGALGAIVRQYGWRAYAVPILTVVTIAALATTKSEQPSSEPVVHRAPVVAAWPTATGNTSVKADQPGAAASAAAISAAELPPGSPYTERGTGTFKIVAGTSVPVGAGRVLRYAVEVENGVTGVDAAAYAQVVDTTLADARSWAGHSDARLQRVDSGPVDLHISLVSPLTVRDLCGYEIAVETSCNLTAGVDGTVNRVVLNLARWVRGDAAYLGDPASYRIYMVNHEVGHALGHQHAHDCLPGGLAPVMMQQTFGLRAAPSGQMCQANPWPYPPGVSGTPGAEEPDTPQNSEFTINGD